MIVTIAEVCATVVDLIMILWFIPKFVGGSISRKKWTLVFPVLWFVCQLFLDSFFKGFDLIPIAIILTILFCFAVALRPDRLAWALFATSSFVVQTMLGSSLLYLTLSYVVDDIDMLMQGSGAEIRIIYIVMAKSLQLFLCQVMLWLFKRDKSLGGASGIMSLLLELGTIIGLGALMKLASANHEGKTNGTVTLLAVLLVLVNVALYVFVYQIQKFQRNEFNLKLLNEKAASDAKRAEDAAVIWDEIRKVRHDLNNHFTVMQGYLESGETQACVGYMETVRQTVKSMGTRIQTGNAVADYLINSKFAHLQNVHVQVYGSVVGFDDISDVDFACILGNILDNAAEAVQKTDREKRVELYFSKAGCNRIIVCKNTVSDSAITEGNKLETTKPDKASHGLGHQIVVSTVEKYGGIVDFFEEDGMFGVQITLREKL